MLLRHWRSIHELCPLKIEQIYICYFHVKKGQNCRKINRGPEYFYQFYKIIFTWFVFFGDGFGTCTSKDNQIQKRIGSQSVGSVNRSASSFTSSVQSGNNFVFTIFVCDNLNNRKRKFFRKMSKFQFRISFFHQHKKKCEKFREIDLLVLCNLWVHHPYCNGQ